MEEEGLHDGDGDSFLTSHQEQPSWASLTSELSSHRMLLHDACKSIHIEKVNRHKYHRKINHLTIIILILTNIISITTTGSLTYIIIRDTTQQRSKARGLPLDYLAEAVHGNGHGQSGHG